MVQIHPHLYHKSNYRRNQWLQRFSPPHTDPNGEAHSTARDPLGTRVLKREKLNRGSESLTWLMLPFCQLRKRLAKNRADKRFFIMPYRFFGFRWESRFLSRSTRNRLVLVQIDISGPSPCWRRSGSLARVRANWLASLLVGGRLLSKIDAFALRTQDVDLRKKGFPEIVTLFYYGSLDPCGDLDSYHIHTTK